MATPTTMSRSSSDGWASENSVAGQTISRSVRDPGLKRTYGRDRPKW